MKISITPILEKSRAPRRLLVHLELVELAAAGRDELRVCGCRIAPDMLRQVLFGGFLRDGEKKLPQREASDGVAPIEVPRGVRLVDVHPAVPGLTGCRARLRFRDATQHFLAQRGEELHVATCTCHEDVGILDVSACLVANQRHNCLLSRCGLFVSKCYAWASTYSSIIGGLRQAQQKISISAVSYPKSYEFID